MRQEILVIDAQGGGIGRQIIQQVKKRMPGCFITAVGTNSTATANMLKAGADQGGSGENSDIVTCRSASVIIGPIGIAIADSMLGEVTPAMAAAVGQSSAHRILIPFNHCGSVIAGVEDKNTGRLVEAAVRELEEYLHQ